MFCAHCGHQLADNARFCESCGTPQQPVNAGGPAFSGSVPVKKKKPVWLFLLLGLLVAALMAVGGLVFFGKQTVYLKTETVTENTGYTNTVRYKYNDQGQLLRYQQEYVLDSAYGLMSLRSLRYEYDEDGNLVQAKLEVDYGGTPTETVVEYTYKNGVLADVEVEYEEDRECEVSLTKDGLIESVLLLYEGEEFFLFSFRYYDDGTVETVESESILNGTVSTNSYDELGRVVEYASYSDGECLYRYEYGYLGDSSTQTRIVTYTYEAGEETSCSTVLVEPVEERGRLTELTVTVEAEMDGETYELRLSGQVEWDDLEGLWEPKVKGDMEAVDYDVDLDTLEMELEMDEQGNLLGYSLWVDGTEVMTVEMKYTAIQVPRDYEAPSMTNPVYSLIWVG